MTDNILIEVSDKNTADAIQRELASKDMQVNRLTTSQAVQFGMKYSTDKGSLETTPKEILQLIQITPDAVDALFDTLGRFRDRVKLFINGQPNVLPNQAPLKKKTFEEFVRGVKGG
jgi:hypothetical protein